MNEYTTVWRGLRAGMARLAAFGRGHRILAGLGGAILAFAALTGVAIALLPAVLGMIAPRLDLHQDLYAANRPIAITFLDQSGKVVGHEGAIVGERLSLKQMPAYLPAAFIAMEDRTFWTNPGIDIKGLLRAAWLNLRAGHIVAGGSTITQQVAKIVFLNQNRTFARKFHELLDTAALNKSLSKTQILELYLNRIYLGSGAYGVDGAAHVYFGMSARDLTLAQAAMLATLTPAPSAFSPRKNLEAAQRRSRIVLKAMRAIGAITPAQLAYAEAHPATIVDHSVVDAQNYYFDAALKQAKRLIAVNGKTPETDLIVHTMLIPKLQEAARQAIVHVLTKEGRRRNAHEAAAVVMKPDGAVVALVGGRNYDASTFNRATDAHRQPGSAFKPFVYLAALEEGISPWDYRTDRPVDINGWMPTNYNHEHFGTITLAEALAHSVNTIAVGLEQQVGVGNVIAAARRCGITTPLVADASLALGTSDVTPLELTGAYAEFANGGLKVGPYLVTEVDDPQGQTLYKRASAPPRRTIASHVDRDLNAMLYDVVREGTGRRAALSGYEAAGKTGTTQDNHDAWFEGFTADFVTGVWVGNDNMAPMKYVTGGTLPAEIWHRIMTVAERGRPAVPLAMSPQPQNVPPQADNGGFAYGSAAPAQDQSDGPAAPVVRAARGFWDWLFGRERPQPRRQRPENPGPASAEPPHYHWRSDAAHPGQDPTGRAYGLERPH